MKIVRNRFIPFNGFKAMTILNIIFVREGFELNERDLAHESIHWEQEKEMLIVFFYLWYVVEWLLKSFVWLDFKKAYKEVSFEKEAYENEGVEGYVSERKRYSWFKYI